MHEGAAGLLFEVSCCIQEPDGLGTQENLCHGHKGAGYKWRMRRFLTMLKKMGNCSQYPVIPSSYHYYFGKWTKLNLLSHLCLKVANLHWMEENQGKSRAALLTLISFFRTLDAES